MGKTALFGSERMTTIPTGNGNEMVEGLHRRATHGQKMGRRQPAGMYEDEKVGLARVQEEMTTTQM